MEEFNRRLTPLEENDLRLQTVEMYKYGGVDNVLSSVHMMIQCQKVILEKLKEILEEKYGLRKP